MILSKQQQKIINAARATLHAHFSGTPAQRMERYAREIAAAHQAANIMQKLVIEECILDDGTAELFSTRDGQIIAVCDSVPAADATEPKKARKAKATEEAANA
jgi:hypothetical protein